MSKIFLQKLICETACGHDGNINNLIKLIKIAKKCGAQTIKFQIFETLERAIPGTKEWNIFNKLELKDSNWSYAIKYAKKKKLNVVSDIYGDKSLSIALKNKVDGFKIHSEDFFNTLFIEKVIKYKKPVLISIGGTYRSELYDLISWLDKRKKLSQNIFLVHGIQTFPTPLEEHSIDEIYDLKKKYSKFNVGFGYADHIDGSDPFSEIFPLIALSSGVSFVEKHFTDKRKYKRTDYHSALEEKQLKNFIRNLERFFPLLNKQKSFSFYENKYRNMFKKTPMILKNKTKGSSLNIKEIKFVKNPKNAANLFSHELDKKILKESMNNGDLIKLNSIKQKIGAIIAVRLNSSRFPNKALKLINGVPSISLLIRRLKKLNELDHIILATTTHKRDSILKKIANAEKIDFFKGPLDNVAKRYYLASKKFKLDQIVRVTGDAILCDENMIKKAIKSQIEKNSDVTFIKNMPYGTAKEVMNYKTIKIISQKSIVKENTEYLEWFLENSRNFKVNYIYSKYKFDKSTRLTLDFKEDLILFDRIFKHFNDKHAKFNLNQVLSLLNKYKSLIKINNFLTPKYKKKQINTELNI